MRKWWFVIAALVVTALAYLRVVSSELVWDDVRFIVEWQTPHQLAPQMVASFFSGDAPYNHSGVYRPVRGFLYALSWHLWGTSATPYHVQALMIHLVATLMVMWIGWLLVGKKEMALYAGLLFGLHPVHVEAVSWITASFDTFGILCSLVSVVLFLHKKQLAALCMAGLAFFTYEMTLVLPLLVLCYLWLFDKKRLSRVVPFFLVCAVYWIIRYVVLVDFSRHDYPFGSLWKTLFFMARAVPFYLRLFIWPVGYAVNYRLGHQVNSFFWADHSNELPLPSISFGNVVSLFSIAFIGILLWLGWQKRKTFPLISFFISWFLLSLLPVSQIFPQQNLLADRYLYLGSVGLSLLFAYIFTLISRRLGMLVVLSISLVLFIQTYKYTGVWQNNTTLWTRAVAANPTSSFNHTNLGEAYAEKGDAERAGQLFLQASSLNPSQPINWTNLGSLSLQQAHFEDAYTYLQRAVAVGPLYPAAHLYLGTWYHQQNNLVDAEGEYRTALLLRPLYPEAYLYLGMIAHQQGEFDLAITSYREAIRLKPDFADAYNNMGNVYRDMSQVEEARKAYEEALIIEPLHRFAKINLVSLTEN